MLDVVCVMNDHPKILRTHCKKTSTMKQPKIGTSWIALFLESQRIPPGSRLSTWLHGESAVKGKLSKNSGNNRGNISEKKIEMIPGSNVHLDGYTMERTSREVPPSAGLHASTNFSRPLTTDNLRYSTQSYIHPAFASPFEMDAPCKKPANTRHQRPRQKTRAHRNGLRCMRLKDPRIKCKSIGTFVSGTVLAVVLTVCEFRLIKPQTSLGPDFEQI